MYHQTYAFNAGEISRRLHARSDLEKYALACARLENFIALPYGGITNRPGTEYIAAAKETDRKCRLIPFSFSTTTNFILELGHGFIRFYSNGTQVAISNPDSWVDATDYEAGDSVLHGGTNHICLVTHTANEGSGEADDEPGVGSHWYALDGAILEIPAPWSEEGLFEIQFLQVKDVIYLVHPDHPVQRLIRRADDAWSLSAVEFDVPGLLDENVDKEHTLTASAKTGAITLTSSKDLFDPLHEESLWQISHRRDEAFVEYEITSDGTSDPIIGRGEYVLKTTGNWQATVHVEQSLDNGTSWETIRSYSSKNDRNVEVTASVDRTSLLRVRISDRGASSGGTTPRAVLEVKDSFVHGLVKIDTVTDAKTASATVLRDLYVEEESEDPPEATDYWSEGAWSEKNGYPRTVALHENRLIFGGTAAQPLTVWGSVIDDYENFVLGTHDDDAFSFTISSQRNNLIQWMVSQSSSLILGTSGAEFTMQSRSSEDPITPTNVSVREQSNYGSAFLQARLVNDSLVFLQRLKRKLREYSYRFERDGYGARDLTLLAEHITEGSVQQTAFAQQPDAIFWAVAGGKLIGLTYEREQDVAGWHQHTTNGEFESVTTIPGPMGDEVWVSVKREVNGETRRYLERLHPGTPTSAAEGLVDQTLFLDAGILKTHENAVTEVTGLDHLEGSTVGVLIDGATHPDRVVSGGTVTLQSPAKTVAVGWRYNAIVETLPLVTQTQSGSTRGRIGRIHRATIDLYRTLSLEFTHRGADAAEDHWDTLPFRSTSDPMDSHPPLFTGQKEFTFAGQFDRKVTAAFRQTKPQPVTILALMLEWDAERG